MFIEHCISQKLPSFCGVRRDQFFIQKRLKNTKQEADDTSTGTLLPSQASHTSDDQNRNPNVNKQSSSCWATK